MMMQDAPITSVDDRATERDAELTPPQSLVEDWPEDRWCDEIRIGAAYTQSIMEKSRPRIERYGNGYRTGWNEHPDDLNNYPLKFMNTFTAMHASGCPRIRAESYRGPALMPVAKSMQDGFNAWAVQDHCDQKLNQCVWDSGFDFGVYGLCLETRADPEGKEMLASVGMEVDEEIDEVEGYRVLPNRFIIDPRANNPDEAEWAGHFEPYELDEAREMMAKYGATAEEIARLDSLIGEAAREMREDVCGFIGETVNRDEVVILHLWRRKTQTMHFFGVTSRRDSRPQKLMEPKPYHGPPNGPYVVVGVRWIRGNALPLAPLASTDKTLDESNAHRGQMRDDARLAKQNVRFSNSDDANTYNAAPNASAIVVTDDSERSGEVIKTGGINEENLKASEMCDRELDAITGLSAAAQGQLGESDNATEVAVSDAKMTMRQEGERRVFRSRVAELARRVCWYILNTPSMRLFIESVDPKTGQKKAKMLIGGEPDSGVTPEDLGIDVVPYSHEYVNEQQMRANQRAMMEDLFFLVDRAKLDPVGVNYSELWRRQTDMNNYGDGSAELVDWAVITQNAMMAQQAALMAPPGGEDPGPQTGTDDQVPAKNITQQVRSGAARIGAQTRRTA